MESRNLAKWIWIPGFSDSDPELPGKFVLFRKSFEVSQIPTTTCHIHVSADTRYRLFINGKSVSIGPCKSYPTRWFYETIDISQFLRTGTNIITARVLRFFPGQIGSSSMMKANVPGFILWGDINGTPVVSDETWSCYEDQSVNLQPRSQWNFILGPPFLSLDETVDMSKSCTGWQDDDTNLTKWTDAVPAVKPIKMMPAMEPWKLFPRPIPALTETPKAFHSALKCTGASNLQDWNDLITSDKSLSIQANDVATVEFESSVLTTGFPEFEFIGGSDAEVTILYAEAYEKDLGTDKAPFPLPRSKGNRRDWENGRLYGMEDHVRLSAAETIASTYEPFWFRTFRFIRLSISTKATPVTITRLGFRETHYPLEITTDVNLTPELQDVWKMCLNTLRNCMHETYEDCPFYEQNQFAMDGRLQLLFTYQLSRDDRLARKTIHEFHAGQRDDGLLETNFPVSFRAINIPQFSLFWILMLHDHMQYFGDSKLVRTYVGTADRILEHFEQLLNRDGLVGAFDSECWAFIDWVKEWHGSKGIRDMAVPPIYKKSGVAAYNSLLYSWVLQHAADLCDFVKRTDTAREYRERADALNHAVKTHCYNGTFFTDGPGAAEICEHTQIFAILSGAIDGDEAVQLMHRTMEDNTMPRCSYSMKHYVFRALAKTGLYNQYFPSMMKTWYRMVKDNLTTCAEDDLSFRSDCHGWSASPIYEIVAEIYGFKPGQHGWHTMKLEPMTALLQNGGMKYQLPDGEVSVTWSEGGDVKVDSTDARLKIQLSSQESVTEYTVDKA